MEPTISPRILKGFRDLLPKEALQRREIERALEDCFRSFGFLPIDTPALEYAEILLGKGGGETDKQVYRFHDHGSRDVAMRFDLTVPFARYMAMHEPELQLPFKRYHIGKVWRGENTQRGRFREFMQCDFDIVGIDAHAADVEILLMMRRTIGSLGFGDFRIHFAHRGLFNAFLERIGAADQAVSILRIVDKLAKIGVEEVEALLSEILPPAEAKSVLSFITREDDFDTTLGKLEEFTGGRTEFSGRLREIHDTLDAMGLSEHFILDPSITRGLDYYTGIVYETFLTGYEAFGSVCSGGRYNNLASLYTDSEIPGVGASIGLDRLMAVLQESQYAGHSPSVPQVVIFNLDDRYINHYFAISERIRDAGFSCEVFFEKRKLGQQFKRAERLESKIAVICGEDEYRDGVVGVKQLESRESFDGLSIDEAIDRIRILLDESG